MSDAAANEKLREAIRSEAGGRPDVSAYSTIPFLRLREIAGECGVQWREAEIEALSMGICPSRYERSMGTIGLEGQIKLLRSCAAVVGLGGLGGLAADLLARAGVGRLILIDGDDFSDSNLNRQLLCTEAEIGRGKGEAAVKRVAAINDAVEVEMIAQYIESADDAEIFLGNADIVIDALDGNRARNIVSTFCKKKGIPFVHGAIGGLWAQAALFCPNDRTPWDTDGEIPDKGVELSTGNPPFTAAFCASLQTAMAVQAITGKGNFEKGVLHWFDLGEVAMERVRV